MRRVRKKGSNKEKVFGCDLLEHLNASSQEVPLVLRSCSEFVEQHGVVDGIYRLSGVSSNIQKLRSEFESDGSPDLNKDVYLQDIHCVSSLCKAYFRELPNPLLTYQLYDKFAEAVAIQLEEERLVKIRDVLKELPPPHHRTLEFLMSHLVRMASHSSETNMHARNLAIVWAPNLLRSKDIEASGFNGTAAFMEVRVQSIVVEFILTHIPQLFPEKGASSERRKSLPSPSAMSGQEEGFFKPVLSQPLANFGNISPGDGPLAIRPYHAIIEGTDKRKGSLKGRRWMSIFNIGGRFHDPRRRHKHSTKEKEIPALRPARSMDSLSTPSYPNEAGSRRPTQTSSSTNKSNFVASPCQSGMEVGVCAGAVGGSEYAVTYRRGTGPVSGAAGTPGTYTALDPEGVGVMGNDDSQSKSPGLSTKVGRRAAMHITGPTLVTVPLHITTNLALGVLQGGGSDRVIHRGRDKDGGDRVEGKEGGEKVQRKESGVERKVETVRKVSEGDKNQRERVTNPAEVGDEEGTRETGEGKGAKKEEAKQGEELRNECRWSLKPTVEGPCVSREKRAKSLNSNTAEDAEDADHHVGDNDEYMEMKGMEPVDTQKEANSDADSDVLNSTKVESDDQELSGYVQDNFEFLDQMDYSILDHMDCSAPSQVTEFSVEPPGHSDDEYELMEQTEPSHHPAEQQTHMPPDPETHTQSQSQLNSHQPLSMDTHDRHTKSLSLPYMTSPVRGAESSSEEETMDDATDDDHYSSEEDETMFVKSLPSDFFLYSLCGLEPDTDGQDSCALSTVPADQSQSSGKTESESVHPEFSAGKQPSAGFEEKGEVTDEDELEREDVTKEKEDAAHWGEDQAEGNMQSGVMVEGVSEDAQHDKVEHLSPDASTHCCEVFLLPNTEDPDQSSTDTQDEKGSEDDKQVDDLHVDYCHAVSCGTWEESADAPAEEFRDLSERGAEQFTWKKNEDIQTDKEIEDTCQREEKRCRSETDVDTEMILETKENMWEELMEGGTEETARQKPQDKIEEHGKEQDSAHNIASGKIWDELEVIICEVIEDEESKRVEKKHAEVVDRQGHVVRFREDVAQTVTLEEEVINKTKVKTELVEEQTEATKKNHKDPEMQREFEGKEINLLKRSKSDKAAREKHAVDEDAKNLDREEVVFKEQQKDDSDTSAERQHGSLPSLGEKDTQVEKVKLDITPSKEGLKCEEREGSQGGVGRRLVISKRPSVKIYQVKAVPIVPPKPQHCKMTALTLRQQQQQQQRERRDIGRESPQKALTEQERGCVAEQVKDRDVEDEGRGKREKSGFRVGERDRERTRDGDESAMRDTTRNSPLSMCFDEAVAIATMRREKEKECEKERQRDWGGEGQ